MPLLALCVPRRRPSRRLLVGHRLLHPASNRAEQERLDEVIQVEERKYAVLGQKEHHRFRA